MKPLFDSDYLEGAHPRILDALRESNMDQTPGYGMDDRCAEAAGIIREICGAPSADVFFLVGGTQTNMTVIGSVLRPHQGVLCASTGHISAHETGAIEHSGHKVLALPARDGRISAGQIAEAFDSHRADPNAFHTVQPGMAYISFPTELGTIYSRKELEEISETCRTRNLPLFIDGARLGYGLTSDGCDVTLQDIARLADVFYIGGTKQGALFGEAVVICNASLKKDFRYFMKQNGGLLAKGRLLGIQFTELLRDGLYFDIAANANRQAAKIRESLAANGFELYGSSRTNQVFTVMDDRQMEALAGYVGFEFWERTADGRSVIRLCTSWATTDTQVGILTDALSTIRIN